MRLITIMHTKQRLTIILLLLFLTLSSNSSFSVEKKSLSLGVVPQMPAQVIRTIWYPLLEKISEISHIELRLITYPNIAKFESALKKGEIDLAYMNPYHLLMTQKHIPYIPLVRDHTSKLIGILVVKKNSDIKSIQDLNNAEIAFPSPNAFGASLYMRALLSEKEGIKFTSNYTKTHSNVYRNVIFSKSMAGGGVMRTLNSEPERIKAQLRILYKTPGVAPHPLSAHPDVSNEQQKLIIDSFISLSKTEAGKYLLELIKMKNPGKADFNLDYKPLLNLHLDKYSSSE